MIFLGQDKGHGPKWPKPLSAHLFLRDVARRSWDAQYARLPIAPWVRAGTQPVLGVFGCYSGTAVA